MTEFNNTGSEEQSLVGISVMLSASYPGVVDKSLNTQEILSALILLTQRILRAGGEIVFGGHPTVTPLVRKAAQRANGRKGGIQLYQLCRYREEAPEEIWDTEVFGEVHWAGSESKDSPVDPDFAEMRESMALASRAAVFIGGKTEDYTGSKPGIRDEYERFLNHHPDGPVYLLGMMNGETERIIRELEADQQTEPNGLSEQERRIVRHGDNIDLIVPIVLHDIARCVRK